MTSVRKTIHLPDPDASPIIQTEQLNGNMLQQNPFFMPFITNVNTAPFETDQGWGENEVRPLEMVPTLKPIRNPLNTTIENYNEMNLNPNTFHGGDALGNLPRGFTRNEIDPSRRGKIYNANNLRVKKEVLSRERPVYVKPSRLGEI